MEHLETQGTQNLALEAHLFVDCDGRKAGGCFIDFGTKELVLIEDIAGSDNDLLTGVGSLITHFTPSKVMLSSRSDSAVCDWVNEQSAQQNFSYDLLKSKMYNFKSAVNAIDDLLDGYQSSLESSVDSTMFTILSELKFSKELSIARNSFGALTRTLENLTIMDEIHYTFSYYVKFVTIFTPSDYVYMDRDSYFALQIFNSLTVPRGSGIKNSVFDYMNMTGSPLGSKKLISWFNSPLATIEAIQERQRTIRILSDGTNQRFFQELVSLQKKVGNIQQTLASIETSKPTVSNWMKLDCYARTGLEIINTVNSFAAFHDTSIGQRIIQQADIRCFKEVILDIMMMIDFDASQEYKRVYIKDGVDEQLDEWRKKYTTLDYMLQTLASELLQIFPQFTEDALNVVYIPQLGYLISIDLAYTNLTPSDWSEVFKTATTAYYKDDYMSDIDEKYGDVYQLMVDYEIELLYLLQAKITEQELDKALLSASSLFAELDCFLSLTSVAILHDFVAPQMVEDSILFIDKGRHILVEQSVNSFVPNDTMIPEQTLSIITGANSSGKSVYLTHVGIIVFLAHIGSYVPATRATIGITDKILTRIVTREAIDKCESTFFIDLQKMSKCLAMSSPKSIMLVDEFGKGTDTLGGTSLLGSIIEDIAHHGVTSRTLITTHFHELFKEGVLNDVQRVKHSHMNVAIYNDEKDGITYLYQLKDGLCENSFGIECARVCGIPDKIIARARQIAESRNDDHQVVQDLNQKQLQNAKEITKSFLIWDIDTETSIEDVKGQLKKILGLGA